MITLLPIALTAVATASPAPLKDPAPLSPVQNILMIVIDDIGTEYLDWWPQTNFASNLPPTPNMQAVAQAGVIFSKYYTQPLCSPTRAMLMSGRQAFESGLGSNPADPESLSTSWNSIPDIVKATTSPTWVCGAFGKWHLGAVADLMHPIDSGFDHFCGTEANVHHPTSSPTSDHFDWWKVTADAGGATRVRVAGLVNDESIYSLSVTGRAARLWINAQTGPYFAYVCLNVPHGPQQVPPHTLLSAATVSALPVHFVPGYEAVNAAERRAIYRLAIEALDTEIGKIVAVTNPADTMVVVVGDNGTPKTVADTAWSRKGKGTVYDPGVRVPMFVRGPVTQFPGTICTQLVSALDVRPTIVELASGTMPTEIPAPEGMDFTPIIKNPSASWGRTSAFCQLFEPNGAYTPDPVSPAAKTVHDRSITDGTIHYLRVDFDPLTGTYVEEAYDLSVDPLETNDLLSSTPTPAPTSAQLALIAALSAEMTLLSGL